MSEHSQLETALAQAVRELQQDSIPYMLIGGLAMVAWGLPRATLDIDLTLWVGSDDLRIICERLAAAHIARVPNPWAFVQKTRVLPVVTHAGVRIDFLFAAFPFEKTMIERARVRVLGDATIRTASLEDLILLKIASQRERDREDIHSIVGAHGNALEWTYLLSIGGQLAEALDAPDIAERLTHLHEESRR